MERILSDDEIKAAFEAKSAEANEEGRKRTVVPWNIREAGQLASEQARILSTCHETFARNLSNTLGAYLRVPFDMRIESIQQLTYDEFLALLPESPYVISYNLEPHDAVGAMHLDYSIVFPLVDLLLGGNGAGQLPEREISDIEEQIVASVARIICKELQSVWQPFGLDLQIGERRSITQLQRLLHPTFRALVLTFKIGVADAQGTMNLFFPASLCNTLLRQVSKDWAYRHPRTDADSGQRMSQRLLACKFRAELALSVVPVKVKEILSLESGAVLMLPIAANNPATLLIEQRRVFDAFPVRVSKNRAAHLGNRIQMKEKRRDRQ